MIRLYTYIIRIYTYIISIKYLEKKILTLKSIKRDKILKKRQSLLSISTDLIFDVNILNHYTSKKIFLKYVAWFGNSGRVWK